MERRGKSRRERVGIWMCDGCVQLYNNLFSFMAVQFSASDV